MRQRMMLLMIVVSVLLGVGFCIAPSLQEQTMIRRLGGSNNGRAYFALLWLVKHRGAAGFELGYTHGTPYIQREIPSLVHELFVGPNPAKMDVVRNMPTRRLTPEETFAILLRGLRVADLEAKTQAAFFLQYIQNNQPLLTARNVAQVLPLLNQPYQAQFTNSPLWSILESTPDHAMLDEIPDSVFLQVLSGRYPGQAHNALLQKYKTREVRWKHGTAGAINMPNSLLLVLLQSPYVDAQITACQQLACNYDAVAINDLADHPTSDPLHGYGGDINMRYHGPPLRNNRAVEKAMGISTAEVIHTLDGIYKNPNSRFPKNSAYAPELWFMLTGKQLK